MQIEVLLKDSDIRLDISRLSRYATLKSGLALRRAGQDSLCFNLFCPWDGSQFDTRENFLSIVH